MNKKLTSVLLAALLFGQPSMCSYVSANNAEFTPNETSAQSNANQNNGFSFSKIALGIAGAAGIGLATACLIHHFKGQPSGGSTSGNTSCKPDRRLALNDAVGQLYNPKDRENILSFPRERAEYMMKNVPLDLAIRSALTVTLALNEAFRNAASNPSAIDLKLNERLFTVLNENIIKDCDNFTAALRGMIEVSHNFVTQPQPKTNPENHRHAPKGKSTTGHTQAPSGTNQEGDRRTLEIEFDAKGWLDRNQNSGNIATPLRSIKWHDHLCWLHASILLFFHERNYREFICHLTDDMFENKLFSEDLNEADRAVLSAMWQLSDMFKDLARDPERGILCVDYENTGREQSLIGALRTAYECGNIRHNRREDIENYRYGDDCLHIARELFNLIRRSSEILELNNSGLPTLAADGTGFVGFPELRIVHSEDFAEPVIRGHYWLEISSDGQGQKLAIGELTGPARSIEIEHATGFGELSPELLEALALQHAMARDNVPNESEVIVIDDDEEKSKSPSSEEEIIIDDEKGKPADPATTNEGSAPEEEKPAKTGKKNNPKATNKKKQNKSTRKSRKPSSAGKKGKSKSIDRK